jgi:hypothetical protein
VRLAGQGPAFFGVRNAELLPASAVTGDFSVVVASPIFNLAFKTLLFGFDVATGLLIYSIVSRLTGDNKRATIAFVLWFLNPLVIYESAIHGATDTIIGFVVLSTISLVLAGRPFWAGVAWVIGILVKLSPLALGLELVLMIALTTAHGRPPRKLHVKDSAAFVGGVALSAACLLMPEAVFGSVSNMLHNNFARGQEPIVIGGLSLMGVRHLKAFSWLLPWAFEHSPVVLRVSELAQALAAVAWSSWAILVARRNPVLGLLGGTVGVLASIALLSPTSNPQYVLWWLPALIVLVVRSRSGYWQLGVLTAAPLAFAVAILGPFAVLGPLATYTDVLPATFVGNSVIRWTLSPGKLWGATLADDFFAPAAFATLAALASLFFMWFRLGLRGQRAWK